MFLKANDYSAINLFTAVLRDTIEKYCVSLIHVS